MNDIVSYPGNAQVQVKFDGETVWLTQRQMAELFGCDRTNIAHHLTNIFNDGELEKEVVCEDFSHTTQHGAIEGKTQTQTVTFYNLDAIISVGYRVNSKRGVQFRQWATKVLKERLLRDYVPKAAAAQSRPLPAVAEDSPVTVELVRSTLYDNIREVFNRNDVSSSESVFVWDSVASEWLGRRGITMQTVRSMMRKGRLGFIVPEKSNFPTHSKDRLRAHGLFIVDSWHVRDDIASKRRAYETCIIGRDTSGLIGVVRRRTVPCKLHYKASVAFGEKCFRRTLPGGVVI